MNPTVCARCGKMLAEGYYETSGGPVCKACATDLGFANQVAMIPLENNAGMQSGNNMFGAAPDISGGMNTMGQSFGNDGNQGNAFSNNATNNPFNSPQGNNPFNNSPNNNPFNTTQNDNPFGNQVNNNAVMGANSFNDGGTQAPTQQNNTLKAKPAKAEKVKGDKKFPHGLLILAVLVIVVLILVVVSVTVVKKRNAGEDNNTNEVTDIVNISENVTTDVPEVTNVEPEVSETEATSAEFDPTTIIFEMGLDLQPASVGINGQFVLPITYNYDSKVTRLCMAVDAKDILNQPIMDLAGSTFMFDYSGDDIVYEDDKLMLDCSVTSIYTDEPVAYATFSIYYVEFEDGTVLGTEEYEPGCYIASLIF